MSMKGVVLKERVPNKQLLAMLTPRGLVEIRHHVVRRDSSARRLAGRKGMDRVLRRSRGGLGRIISAVDTSDCWACMAR